MSEPTDAGRARDPAFRVFPNEREAEILSTYRAGATLAEVAARLDTIPPEVAVVVTFARAGRLDDAEMLQVASKHWQDVPVINAWRAGWTVGQIADSLGLSDREVYLRVRRYPDVQPVLARRASAEYAFAIPDAPPRREWGPTSPASPATHPR